jgi:osmoprotectant transport system ATP-binding protein
VIELRGVSKRYGEQRALAPTDLSLVPGDTTVLIGSSGSGKSTMLRLMLGLIAPDSGSVYVDGVELSPGNVLELRRRMGYVIQDGGLFPHLDARGNASLLAGYLGWESGRVEARIAELCELTHFPADGLARFPGQLSGGQRQRVSLMRALMLDPEVLLLDEPLGALDPMIRSDLQNDLREIFRALGKTVVLVTHDIGEAAFFGDRVVLLREGAVLQDGAFAQLVEAPADPFVTRFINAQRSPLDAFPGGTA